MKTKAAMAAEKKGDKNRVSVQIYMPNQIWTGSVHCPHKRLTDSLNSAFTPDEEFVVLAGPA
ncbi:MAG: hypothetical protein PHY25_05160 [Dehalococcoidales bacterium]|nr:hypothetical protein [Limnochordia bacterium]MDD4466046.1 hypothetical protein [Dehalococcoidales bacterium]MDX9804022.1 hypothetical protein [Dehalococcoidales bacterium]